MSLHELRTLIARHCTDGVTSTAIPGVLVARVDSSDAQESVSTGSVLAIVAQGNKRLSVGSSVHEYGAGDYLVTSMELPVSGRYRDATPEHPALGFGLELRPDTIAELLLTPASSDALLPRRTDKAPPAVVVGTADARLLDAAVRMLRLLDHPRDIPVLAPLIERELLWLIMSGESGDSVRQLGLADSSLNRVRHVVRWMRGRYAEPMRVDELAQRARMSPSAFHRAFHAVTAMSPIQYQKSVRLQEARLRLLADPADIAGAAYAVGYESLSQFSREYRRQFGAPPSRDVPQLLRSDGRSVNLSPVI
ncbi:AraC family transcriptional regulator [Microbacterium neimengense]